jgi:hypothetical protein
MSCRTSFRVSLADKKRVGLLQSIYSCLELGLLSSRSLAQTYRFVLIIGLVSETPRDDVHTLRLCWDIQAVRVW